MSVRYLAETIVTTVRDHIKSNITGALSDLRLDRGDAKVSTEPPQSYFIYEKAKGYRTPACFTILRNMNFQKSELGANHITGKADVTVSVLVEDKDAEKLTVKAWRYHAALHNLLDQTNLLVSPNKAKLFVIVRDASFSPIFTAETAEKSAGVFRKEVALLCEVQHREAF